MKIRNDNDYAVYLCNRESLDESRSIADGDESVYTLQRFSDDMTAFADMRVTPTMGSPYFTFGRGRA